MLERKKLQRKLLLWKTLGIKRLKVAMQPDYYELLRVSFDCRSEHIIKKNAREQLQRLSKVHLNALIDTGNGEWFCELKAQIIAAQRTLIDPLKRALYDERLKKTQLRPVIYETLLNLCTVSQGRAYLERIKLSKYVLAGESGLTPKKRALLYKKAANLGLSCADVDAVIDKAVSDGKIQLDPGNANAALPRTFEALSGWCTRLSQPVKRLSSTPVSLQKWLAGSVRKAHEFSTASVATEGFSIALESNNDTICTTSNLPPQMNSKEPFNLELQLPDREETRVFVCASGALLYEGPAVIDRSHTGQPVSLRFTPLTVGECRIDLEIFQNRRYIGAVNLKTYCTSHLSSNLTPATPVRHLLKLPNGSPAPDVTLVIKKTWQYGSERRYTILVAADKLDLSRFCFGETDTVTGLSDWVDLRFEHISDAGRNGASTDARSLAAGFGVELYDKIFPDRFKTFFWDRLYNNESIDSIVIISDDPWIPWELAKPHRLLNGESQEAAHLCETLSTARWLSGQESPGTELRLNDAAVLPLNGPHASHCAETRPLLALRENGVEVYEIEPTLEHFYQFAETRRAAIFHYSGHNKSNFGDEDSSWLEMKNGEKLYPWTLNGSRTNFLRYGQPLVFLNACGTFRGGQSHFGTAGWAERCLREGATSFIGTYWEVVDNQAAKFSEVFYQNLLQKKETIAKSVRAARKAIRKDNDPTWLAYSLFAHPMARLA